MRCRLGMLERGLELVKEDIQVGSGLFVEKFKVVARMIDVIVTLRILSVSLKGGSKQTRELTSHPEQRRT